MRAGLKATFVEIQRATIAYSGATNAKVPTWSKIGEAWVSFVPQRGTEDYVDGARTTQRVVRLTGDYLEFDGVETGDRLLDVDHGNAILDIKAILPKQDTRDEVWIDCTQGEGAR